MESLSHRLNSYLTSFDIVFTLEKTYFQQNFCWREVGKLEQKESRGLGFRDQDLGARLLG